MEYPHITGFKTPEWNRESMSEGRVCCINHTVLKDITRPSLHCEEVAQEDGGFKLGKTSWSAVTFKADIDAHEYTGSFYKVALIASPTESWNFYNAKIALLPDTKLDESHFVMVFDRCERVPREV